MTVSQFLWNRSQHIGTAELAQGIMRQEAGQKNLSNRRVTDLYWKIQGRDAGNLSAKKKCCCLFNMLISLNVPPSKFAIDFLGIGEISSLSSLLILNSGQLLKWWEKSVRCEGSKANTRQGFTAGKWRAGKGWNIPHTHCSLFSSCLLFEEKKGTVALICV